MLLREAPLLRISVLTRQSLCLARNAPLARTLTQQVGDGADGGFKPGDRVFGGNMIGCFAEYASVDPDNMRRIPSGMSMREAAGLYVTLPTSYAALALRGRLQPGETCLVLGAAGGVGIYAVQIAKAMGAKVIAVAGSKDKLDVCAANGADAGVNYREDDWVKQVKDLTGGRGVDVVYDPVGMPTECTKCMAWKSRYVVVGFAGGDIPKLALNRVLLKQIEVIGLHWGAYEVHEPEAISPTWDACIKLYTEGKIKPAVYPETFPLEKTADALVQVAARKTHGKVIIDVDTTLDSEAARSRL